MSFVAGSESFAVVADFPDADEYLALLRLAVREDLGDAGDVTSRLSIPADVEATGTAYLKAPGVACGLPAVEHVLKLFDEKLRVEVMPNIEATYQDAAQPVALCRMTGLARSLLAAERTVLNLLGRLSGVATETHRYVQRVEGTEAKIYDTRKTTPGLRMLEKYAVRAGGGCNHRIGLFDMALFKDNHLALAGGQDLATAARQWVRQSRDEAPDRPIEIEVDTLVQFRQILGLAGIDVILLDNMDLDTMRVCVAERDAAGSQVALEASGGVTLETVRDVAETGVDRIAIGAITHSAPSLDIGLDVVAR
jgi:nicotinate-nucleotide pyrophosphorylase (carboxylating)